MQFIIRAYDGENKLDRRIEVRPRHLENLKNVPGKILCAGGLLDGEGRMKGSVLIMDFGSRADLERYLASEPCIREGVWEKVETEPMNFVILGDEKVSL